jgi:hypothetical protein
VLVHWNHLHKKIRFYLYPLDLDKVFKAHELKNTGALSQEGMRKVIREMFPEFTQEDELDTVMLKHLKVASYTVLNKETGNFDVRQSECNCNSHL